MSDTYFPTKYDSAAEEVIAILADENEGFGRASTGETDAPTGYVQLVILDSTCDLDFADTTNYPAGDLAGETARTYGVTEQDVTGNFLVTTNSQGFVSVERFESPEVAQERFDCLESHYDFWADEDRDESGPNLWICSVPGHGYHTL